MRSSLHQFLKILILSGSVVMIYNFWWNFDFVAKFRLTNQEVGHRFMMCKSKENVCVSDKIMYKKRELVMMECPGLP